MISSKTLNIDNPKLNCRLKNMQKFSPIRVVLDNKLEANNDSYIFKTANKDNTIFIYNEANKSNIHKFKIKKIQLLKSKIDKYKKFDIKRIMKKLYKLGCRNILVEGGDDLTQSFLKKKLFNQFYLFKSSKSLSNTNNKKAFNSFNVLKQNYKNKFKLNANFGKDKIILYKR